MESLKASLQCAASLIAALSSENAVSFLAWWKGGQYLTFYPVELIRQYYREESQEIISDYIHRAVINHSLTVEVGMNSLALPRWRDRSKTEIWKPGDPEPDLSQHLNLEWLTSLRHRDERYSMAHFDWCEKMLSFAARPDVTLLQIPPAKVKLKYSRRDAILRMAYFPELREMVACELNGKH